MERTTQSVQAAHLCPRRQPVLVRGDPSLIGSERNGKYNKISHFLASFFRQVHRVGEEGLVFLSDSRINKRASVKAGQPTDSGKISGR